MAGASFVASRHQLHTYPPRALAGPNLPSSPALVGAATTPSLGHLSVSRSDVSVKLQFLTLVTKIHTAVTVNQKQQGGGRGERPVSHVLNVLPVPSLLKGFLPDLISKRC